MQDILCMGDVIVRPRPSAEISSSKKAFMGWRTIWLIGLFAVHLLGFSLGHPLSILVVFELIVRFERLVTLLVANLACLPKPRHNMEVKKYKDGYAFLATCRQARREGQNMFFASNTFHLPTGTITDTRAWMDQMSPKSWCLIPTMATTFTLADLKLENLRNICNPKRRCNPRKHPDHDERCTCLWTDAIGDAYGGTSTPS